MIESVFELGDPIVREIMVPRPDVETVPASMSLSELRSAAAIGAFTRYLVLDDDGEQAVGFVHVEDVLRASEAVTDQDHPLTARELARELFAVPETRRIDEILTDFQTCGEGQIAVVFDEWGIFEGIVTIEDVLEEFVGDIQDESDTAAQELSIATRDDGTHVVDGGVPGRAVNDQLDTEFESDEVESIGGSVFSHRRRVPQVGDQIEQNRYVLEVEAVEDARIDRLVIRRLRPEQGTRNESEN